MCRSIRKCIGCFQLPSGKSFDPLPRRSYRICLDFDAEGPEYLPADAGYLSLADKWFCYRKWVESCRCKWPASLHSSDQVRSGCSGEV